MRACGGALAGAAATVRPTRRHRAVNRREARISAVGRRHDSRSPVTTPPRRLRTAAAARASLSIPAWSRSPATRHRAPPSIRLSPGAPALQHPALHRAPAPRLPPSLRHGFGHRSLPLSLMVGVELPHAQPAFRRSTRPRCATPAGTALSKSRPAAPVPWALNREIGRSAVRKPVRCAAIRGGAARCRRAEIMHSQENFDHPG